MKVFPKLECHEIVFFCPPSHLNLCSFHFSSPEYKIHSFTHSFKQLLNFNFFNFQL